MEISKSKSTTLNRAKMTKPRRRQPPKQKAVVNSEIEPKPTAKIGKQYFAKKYYIQGYGIVEVGQEVTAEILKLWNSIKPPATNE